MPELPEVENLRQYLEQTSLGKKVRAIEIDDNRILKQKPTTFQKKIIGAEWIETSRIGKFLFVKNQFDKWLIFHFGLTGDLNYSFKDVEAPRFTRVLFSFENDYQLSFINMRKFGWVDVVDDKAIYLAGKKLGPDALEINEKEFIATFSGKKAVLKSFLLKQDYFAGIGNWIADEMLFNTKIHPEKRVNELKPNQIKKLYKEMQVIMKTAIQAETHYGDFPEGFFANLRKKGTTCPRCKKEIVKMVVGGRGTFICPKCQK